MVVLHDARPLDAAVEIGIGSHVDIAHAERAGRLPELGSIEHLHPFEDALKAYRTVVGDMELRLAALLRSHLNHARCTT